MGFDKVVIFSIAGYLKAIWPDLFGCVFEVWPAPGALFGRVFGAAGAAQTPNIDDFRPAQEPCI